MTKLLRFWPVVILLAGCGSPTTPWSGPETPFAEWHLSNSDSLKRILGECDPTLKSKNVKVSIVFRPQNGTGERPLQLAAVRPKGSAFDTALQGCIVARAPELSGTPVSDSTHILTVPID